VETFVKGRDIFAVLPMGYGKGLCYRCLPTEFDILLGTVEKTVSLMLECNDFHTATTSM